jgi:hypothetical protein
MSGKALPFQETGHAAMVTKAAWCGRKSDDENAF